MSDLIRQFSAPWYTQTSPGVTPGFIFAENGNVGVNKFLRVGSASSGLTGFPIYGKNRLVQLRISNSSNVSSDTTIQLYERTGESTFSAIQDAAITILTGSYEAQKAFDLTLTDNVELSAKVVSGSLSNPVLNVFLMPGI